MRDMIPPGDRSIRNIPIPPGHHHIQRQEIPEYYQPQPQAPKKRRKRRPGRFLLLALLVIIICGGAAAGASLLNAGADIVVHPRTEQVTASTTIVAQTTAPVGILAFAKLSATQSATTTVPATGTQRVSRQAKGTVTITSTYTASQRLISGTRLQATDGKIYRLAASVDLPANGSVVANMNAESPGADYNRSGSITFTLPGFKGDPRFDKFVAKSNGAITGGFVGEEPAVATADLEAAKAELKAQLDNSTQRQLAASIPETSMAIPGTLNITYGEIVQAASNDKKSATLSQSATASGATVNIRDFASALAMKTVDNYEGEAVDFKDKGTLEASLASSTKNAPDQITIQVKGQTTLVWQFDQNKVKEALLGKSKGEFQKIVESFAPAIKSATATVRPFWMTNFPSEPEKIEIETEIEE